MISRGDTFTFCHTFARDNPGQISDFYDLDITQLGEGAYGRVFKATSKVTSQSRAVKKVSRHKIKNLEKFHQEITIQRDLDHPNVVRLFEVFQDEGAFHLVMEICTGGELFDHIINEGSVGFDETKVAKYMRHILSALNYIHSRSYVHRDVKPENFLLESKDPDADLKLIDFGLAVKQRPGVPLKSISGTPYYVAPEVLHGSYNEKCDIWSAGVIAFILLSGVPPFNGENDDETMAVVKHGVFEFKSPEWDCISDGAKNTITQMLTVSVKVRPGAEFLLDAPWLRYKSAVVGIKIHHDLVKRLRCFQAHSRLKKVVLAVVAQQLPSEELAPLKAVFQDLDVNKDGKLTTAEIREGLIRHNLPVPKALADILKQVDTNGNGELDYTEFLAAIVDRQLYLRDDMLRSAFNIFDINGDGKISREELTLVLAGKDDTRARKIMMMLDEVDGNVDGKKDGHIDFEEFRKMMQEPSHIDGKACGSSIAKRPRLT